MKQSLRLVVLLIGLGSLSMASATMDLSCTFLQIEKGGLELDPIDCIDGLSGYQCEWCGMGPEAGLCVSTEQAKYLNSIEGHVFSCGKKTKTTEMFWRDFWSCYMSPLDACSGICTTCVVDDPNFSVCVNREFIDYAKELQPDSDNIRLEHVVRCEAPDTNIPPLINDYSCQTAEAVEPGSTSTCILANDEQGRSCVYTENDSLYGERCWTKTQTEFWETMTNLLEQNNWGFDVAGLKKAIQTASAKSDIAIEYEAMIQKDEEDEFDNEATFDKVDEEILEKEKEEKEADSGSIIESIDKIDAPEDGSTFDFLNPDEEGSDEEEENQRSDEDEDSDSSESSADEDESSSSEDEEGSSGDEQH